MIRSSLRDLMMQSRELASCSPGKEDCGVLNLKCCTCDAGKYSGGNNCNACSAGTYSNSGAGSCTDCGYGFYSGSGAGSCSSAPAGSFFSGFIFFSFPFIFFGMIWMTLGYYIGTQRTTSCCNNPCASGSYSTGGASVCTLCPAGTFQSSTTQSQCVTTGMAGMYCGLYLLDLVKE